MDGYNASDIDAYRKTYNLDAGKYSDVLVDNAMNIAGAGSIYCQGWGIVGGTSAAAPLWAGIAVDINQYLATQKRPTLGNANTILYRLYTTSTPYPVYHDIVLGNNLYYKATAGYDLATGIGTLNIWNIARGLVALPGGIVKPTPTPSPTVTPIKPTATPIHKIP